MCVQDESLRSVMQQYSAVRFQLNGGVTHIGKVFGLSHWRRWARMAAAAMVVAAAVESDFVVY